MTKPNEISRNGLDYQLGILDDLGIENPGQTCGDAMLIFKENGVIEVAVNKILRDPITHKAMLENSDVVRYKEHYKIGIMRGGKRMVEVERHFPNHANVVYENETPREHQGEILKG